MGAGKTSVGKALAARLGWKFCDLDRAIEQREGRSVAAIFTEWGEAGFRRAESKALKQVLAEGVGEGLVVALGGGAFVQAENRAALDRAGAFSVLLEAPLEELKRRCKADGTVRPLAGDEKNFAALFEARRPAYEMASTRIQTSGKSVEAVAEEIDRMLSTRKAEVKQ
jgi:shikimate kinase